MVVNEMVWLIEIVIVLIFVVDFLGFINGWNVKVVEFMGFFVGDVMGWLLVNDLIFEEFVEVVERLLYFVF